MHLELSDRSLVLPVREDGRFALAEQAVDGIRPMARGFWNAPCTFTFVLDLLGKIDYYTFDIAFGGDAADVSLNERTGLMRELVRATLAR